jgi:hypothetical protein
MRWTAHSNSFSKNDHAVNEVIYDPAQLFCELNDRLFLLFTVRGIGCPWKTAFSGLVKLYPLHFRGCFCRLFAKGEG